MTLYSNSEFLEKRTKNLSIPFLIFFLSFVDNGLLIYQENQMQIFFVVINLGLSLSMISLKFFRATKNFNSLPSDLRSSGGIVLRPKDIWWYFGFFFNRKLSFWYHTHHYTNKLLSIINCIKMLRNSTRGLSPVYKWLLYRTCMLSITLYSFQLWYFKGAPLYHPLKELKKM